MSTWLYSLASVVAVSLVSLVGAVAAPLDPQRLERLARALMSVAVGALLGDAFLHLVPETFARGSATGGSLLVLAGMLLFFTTEKLLRRREGEGGLPTLAALNLFGDGLHNFLDGMLIGGTYLVSPGLGLTTTIAVIAHEVPQELGDFGVLIHSGLTVRRALVLNLLSAAAAMVGTIAALLLGAPAGGALVPIAAGGFVYIAAADLMPELQKQRGAAAQLLLCSLGIAAMVALTWLD